MKFFKPEPYDYTTIPGLHSSDPQCGRTLKHISKNNSLKSLKEKVIGDFEIISNFKNARCFFKWLHLTFGQIASFHWGLRYVVSIANLNLLKEILELIQTTPKSKIYKLYRFAGKRSRFFKENFLYI